MNIEVIQTDWQTHRESLSSIRHEVFVIEQEVPIELELDEFDGDAIHALALDQNGGPLGTGRLLPSGKIGRMAVLKKGRQQGVGSAILTLLTQVSVDKLKKPPYLEAQLHAIPFYERHGYRAEGDIFLDAGIEHRLMKYQSKS